jgi:outer membrane protein
LIGRFQNAAFRKHQPFTIQTEINMKKTITAVAQTLTLAGAICTFSAPDAFAQSTNSTNPNSDWNISLGALVVTTPEYPGSKNERTEVYPFGNVIYKDEFFFSSEPIEGASLRGLGAYLYKGHGVVLTASLAPDLDKRDSSDDILIRDLPDISPTVRAALAASYQGDWWKIAGAVTRDLSQEKKEGVRGGLDLTGIYHPTNDLILTAGPGVSYGNAQYMQTFYGINPAQSQESGLPTYTPSGGITNVHFNLGLIYRINATWNVGSFVSAARLNGDAENSPVVQSRNQTTGGIYFQHQM